MNHQTKLTMMMFIAICIQGGLVAVAYRMSHIKPAKLLIFGGPAGFLIGVATGTLMRCALLLLLCLPAYAALPPMPSVPTVKRPAPLLSPKAASAPRSTPMVRSFTPASVPSGTPPLRLYLTNDVTIIQIDGTPEVIDWHQVEVVQPAGLGVRLYKGEDLFAPLSAWDQVADWAPYVEDQVVGWRWFRQAWTRTPTLFYRQAFYAAPTASRSLRASSLLGGVTLNKSVPGTVTTYTRRLKR